MGVLDKIGDTMVDSMPEVSQHAIDEHNATQERNLDANSSAAGADMLGNAQTGTTDAVSASNPNGWPVDGRGKPYDPNTHEISASTGKAIKKRRGGKSTIGAPTKNATSPNNAPTSQDIGNAQQAAANGQMAALATFAGLQGIFGEEFAPRKESHVGDEFQFLAAAYGNYFLAKGMVDIPPGWALVIAIGSITAPRFGMPKTRTKMQRVKDFIIGKFFSWRAKKTVDTATKNTKEGKLNA